MLSERRIIEAAAAVADAGGIRAVSMRNVAKELGVEAMSLYHHVASKEALLDSLVDWVFEQIATPDVEDPWREAMVARSRSARTGSVPASVGPRDAGVATHTRHSTAQAP